MNQKVIAVDHGNRNIKTIGRVFPSGYKESGHLPSMGADVLTYEGKEYTLVDQRMAQKNDKTGDDGYFILTLFAIGRELVEDIDTLTSTPTGECIEVTLLVGLPPLHCKEMGTRFVEYFKNGGELIHFTFNNVPIAIRIEDVYVYPQAFAAAITAREHFKDMRTVNIVDIGGYTVDLLQLTNMRPDMSVCTSLYHGANTLFQRINERVRAKGARNIPDSTIEGILLEDEAVLQDCKSEYIYLVREYSKQFAHEVVSEVSQAGLDLTENTTVFVGGGSILLKNFIVKTGLVARPIFVDDVHANAKGYELLYKNRSAARTQKA